MIVIHVARKPIALGAGVAQNAQQWGCGGLNIGGCRVGTEVRFSAPATPNKGTFNASFDSAYKGKQVAGRWPANLILTAGVARDEGLQRGAALFFKQVAE